MIDQGQRSYDVAALQRLMDLTGEWAGSWDDVLQYLEGSSERHPEFSAQQVAGLTADIRTLQRNEVPFTRNYREIWNQLDARVEPAAPASASSRVADVMQRLESKEYQEMAAELARNRDMRWKS